MRFWCSGHRIITVEQPCCDKATLIPADPVIPETILLRNLELAVQNNRMRDAGADRRIRRR